MQKIKNDITLNMLILALYNELQEVSNKLIDYNRSEQVNNIIIKLQNRIIDYINSDQFTLIDNKLLVGWLGSKLRTRMNWYYKKQITEEYKQELIIALKDFWKV